MKESFITSIAGRKTGRVPPTAEMARSVADAAVTTCAAVLKNHSIADDLAGISPELTALVAQITVS